MNNEDIRELKSIKRLDDRLLIPDLLHYITELQVKAEQDSKKTIFKTKYKGKLEILTQIAIWIRDYHERSETDLDTLANFFDTVFEDSFKGVSTCIIPNHYEDLSTYAVRFKISKFTESKDPKTDEAIQKEQKKMWDFVRIVNESVFLSGECILLPMITVE